MAEILNDSRASGFDSAAFKDAIRFAMQMAKPNAEEKRLKFLWSASRTYEVSSPSGKPYFYDTEPQTTATPDPVEIDVAVEFISRATSSTGTPVANFQFPRLVITVLDEDYELVAGADKVEMDGSTYTIDYVAPPQGLFDVTIFEIYASAQDES